MYKHTIPSLFPLITPSLTWKVNTTSNSLFLTFDDGPHPDITPKVLDLLDRYGAKATFFCVGENVYRYPGVYEEIIRRGHRTGNHTYNHLSGWTNSNARYYDNIRKAADLIGSDLFRPPYGRITPLQAAVLKKQYRIIMWSILTRDYEYRLNKEKAAANLIAQSGPGDIVVFHDSERAEVNMFYILRQMLDHFSRLHFLFPTL